MVSFLILDLIDFSAASMVTVTMSSGLGMGVPGALKYRGRGFVLSVSITKTSLPLIEDNSEHAGE